MSDETPRSSHGLPPDPRGTNQPPAWWSSLGRDDLPADGRRDERHTDLGWLQEPPAGRRLREVPGVGSDLPSRGRTWLIIGLTALLVALLAVAATAPRAAGIATAAGILLATAVTGTVLLRRRRRR